MAERRMNMTQPTIGVIGLGNMGRGIAANFAKAGHITAVWDISEEARDNLAQTENVVVATPGDMAAAGAMMVYVVPATPEIEASFEGPDGVLAQAAPGTIVYDLTTSFPEDTKRLAARATDAGIQYLDAAMSGGATGADAGTLTLMIGGDEATFEACRARLEAIADNMYFLGEVGAGHAMKLIHNMVTHSIFLTTCEAGRMAERAGLKLSDMIDVFNTSNARSYSSEARFPRHILSETWDARSRVYNLNKDLGMVVRMAEGMGMDARYAKETSAFLNKAIDRGMAEDDYSLLYKVFDDIREDG